MVSISWLLRNGTDWLIDNTLSQRYYIQRLRLNQLKTPNELKAIQLEKMKTIIRYAYDTIPYYHQLFKASKIKPEDLKNQDDLKKIPVTTKKDIQTNYLNFFPRRINLSQHREFCTSGTTGTPIKIYTNRTENIYQHALVNYTFGECGLKPRDKFVNITNTNIRQSIPFIAKLVSLFNNKKFISVKDNLENIISNLKKVKPDAIFTYPSVLSLLSNKDVSGINPRLIFSQGETIPLNVRSIVKCAFGVEINDTYGSVEFRRLAFECNKHIGLHMITDCAVLEFLKDGEPVSLGESGQIIVSSLYNYTMPLIRYNIGDIGILSDEKCTCGRNWPLIKNIEGRTMDYLTLPDGTKTTMEGIYECLQHEVDIYPFCFAQYQIVQEKINRINMKFVKGKEFDAKVITKIKQNIENYYLCLGFKVTIDFQIVDDIPMERTGKRRTVISLIN